LLKLVVAYRVNVSYLAHQLANINPADNLHIRFFTFVSSKLEGPSQQRFTYLRQKHATNIYSCYH